MRRKPLVEFVNISPLPRGTVNVGYLRSIEARHKRVFERRKDRTMIEPSEKDVERMMKKIRLRMRYLKSHGKEWLTMSMIWNEVTGAKLPIWWRRIAIARAVTRLCEDKVIQCANADMIDYSGFRNDFYDGKWHTTRVKRKNPIVIYTHRGLPKGGGVNKALQDQIRLKGPLAVASVRLKKKRLNELRQARCKLGKNEKPYNPEKLDT